MAYVAGWNLQASNHISPKDIIIRLGIYTTRPSQWGRPLMMRANEKDAEA